MVNEKQNDDVPLPLPGEQVEVSWGLESVRGNVLESYQGIRPRVVVEIDAGQVGDETATVTVPLGAVEPAEEARSPWAVSARFERAVADALRRISQERIVNIDLNTKIDQNEVDIFGQTQDGQPLIVEVKTAPRPLSQSAVQEVITRLEQIVSSLNGIGLLVINHPLRRMDVVERLVSHNLGIVTWQGPDDDSELAAALNRLLSAT